VSSCRSAGCRSLHTVDSSHTVAVFHLLSSLFAHRRLLALRSMSFARCQPLLAVDLRLLSVFARCRSSLDVIRFSTRCHYHSSFAVVVALCLLSFLSLLNVLGRMVTVSSLNVVGSWLNVLGRCDRSSLNVVGRVDRIEQVLSLLISSFLVLQRWVLRSSFLTSSRA